MMELEPKELVFRDVRLTHVYKASLTVSNPFSTSADLILTPSAPRYKIDPARVTLRPNSAYTFTVTLQIMGYADYSSGVAGIHDFIRIKAPFSEQKVDITVYLRSRDRENSRSPLRTVSKSSAVSAANAVEELQAQLHLKDVKIKEMQQILSEVEARHPNLQALLQNKEEQLRADFNEKSEKVLRVLRRKDELISSLQEQLEAGTQQLQMFRDRGQVAVREEVERSGKARDNMTGRPISRAGVTDAGIRLEEELEQMRQAFSAEADAHAACRLV
jgi:hypothetical protein